MNQDKNLKFNRKQAALKIRQLSDEATATYLQQVEFDPRDYLEQDEAELYELLLAFISDPGRKNLVLARSQLNFWVVRGCGQ